MGLFNSMTNYAHKSELRESKDEIVCGQIVRGLSYHGWRPYRIVADSDEQTLGFKVPDDDVLSAVYVMVDRKSGSGAISQSMGSRTVIGFTAEMRNKLTDPDDLAAMWRTDLANLFKVPVAGEVRINHQLNTVNARTYHLVNLDDYVTGSTVNTEPLIGWIVQQVDALREQLRPLKKS
jgi:hypothetical protein